MDKNNEQSERGSSSIGRGSKQNNCMYSEATKEEKESSDGNCDREKTPTHSTDPFKGTNEKRWKVPFYQTESFMNKHKAEQRKAFFLKKAEEEKPEGDSWEQWLAARNAGRNWRGKLEQEKKNSSGQNNVAFSKQKHWQQTNVAEGIREKGRATNLLNLREGAAGRVPLGLTKNEVEAEQEAHRVKAREQRKKQKKAEKQRRYRHNKKEKKRKAGKGRRLIKIEKTRFYPRNRGKLRKRRSMRRREYRQFIAALTSELRKKEECKRLRNLRGLDRRAAIGSKKEKKIIQQKIKVRRQKLNKNWKDKWKQWIKDKHKDNWKKQVTWKKGLQKGNKWMWAKRRDRNIKEKRSKEVDKIKMHTKLNLCINNERGINTIAKRQQLAAEWEQEKIDIAIMAETQKNTGGVEEGTSWGNEYITFFSTGISPKKREEQEKKRQKKWDKQKPKKRRNRKRAAPLAKAEKTEERKEKLKARIAKEEESQKGKGKGKWATKRDSDYEHAGVGIAIRKKWKNYVEEVQEIDGRIIKIKLKTAGGGIDIFGVYAPTADQTSETKDNFYNNLTQAVNNCKGAVYIGGDFNARMYERLEHEKEEIGKNLIERKGYVTAQEAGRGICANTRENRDAFISFLKTHDMCAVNTMFEKPPENLVTYKEKVPGNNPESEEYRGENTAPYDYTKYAQCDYFITKKNWISTVKDCETRVDWFRDSDHIPMAATIMTSMKIRKKYLKWRKKRQNNSINPRLNRRSNTTKKWQKQ